MTTAIGIVGLLVIVLVNSAIAALVTRFFRVRLHTRWGSLLYALVLTPFVLVLTIPVYSLLFGRFLQLGSTQALLLLAVAVPLAVGVAFDYFWMPAPDEVDLPETPG